MKETIKIYDDGVLLEIPFEACILYHGKDSIGGLSFGFRLLKWVLDDLCKGEIPERKDITVKTAFPGPGLRDAMEMVTRCVTRGAYQVIDYFPAEAPEGVYGRMYFEISYKGKVLKVYLSPGVFSDEFIATGRAIKKGNCTKEQLEHWRNLKNELSDAVWSIDDIGTVLNKVSL